MISQNQILRLVEAHEYRQLVDRILTNGRCRSQLARGMLNRPEAVPASALGLALQRLAELTYRPSELAEILARRLATLQRPDGLFGHGISPSNETLLAATATAVRGLMTTASHGPNASLEFCGPISIAIDRGLAALAQRYGDGQHVGVDAVGWAIVLWQLGDVPEFRRLVPVDDLLAMLDESETDVVEDELCRYAHAMAA